MNERLRSVMSEQGMDVRSLAAACGVDPKTVERWLSQGRRPHSRQRRLAAAALEVKETELWPDPAIPAQRNSHGSDELVRVYPNRASVPRETWLELLQSAERRIEVLVFSGTFFAQTNPKIARMLAAQAAGGAEVRLCFGDPASTAVAIRDEEEGLHGTLSAKIRASLTYYTELLAAERCGIRLHGATLYASLFRYDEQVLVNPHIWGQPASANPLLHLRRAEEGGWFDVYTESFDAVWTAARQLTAEEGIPRG